MTLYLVFNTVWQAVLFSATRPVKICRWLWLNSRCGILMSLKDSQLILGLADERGCLCLYLENFFLLLTTCFLWQTHRVESCWWFLAQLCSESSEGYKRGDVGKWDKAPRGPAVVSIPFLFSISPLHLSIVTSSYQNHQSRYHHNTVASSLQLCWVRGDERRRTTRL